MWVIFRDPKTAFNHVDKFVVDLVEDKEIDAYQSMLERTEGGRPVTFHADVPYNQHFFTTKLGVRYFAKKYAHWVDDGRSSVIQDGPKVDWAFQL
jgi:hypothetical protein